MSWKNKRSLNVGFYLYYFHLFLHHFIPSQTLTSFTIEYDFLHFVCNTLFMHCQRSTSSQFDDSKHYTMKKACRITIDNPFSVRHNGKKKKFFRKFSVCIKRMIPCFGQQFQNIFFHNNF